jgi:hypothetical protein
MKSFIFLFVCLITVLSCADENAEALQWTKNLYVEYKKNFIEMSILGPNADTIYCPELLKLVQSDKKIANGENGFLDWDPLCDCQDPEGIQIDQITLDRKYKAIYVDLKFTISETKMSLTLKLSKIGKKWLICDVGSPTTPSLYEYLQKSISKLQKDTIDKKITK